MSNINELRIKIDEQRKDHKDKPRYMIGSQLLDICESQPSAVDIVLRDLDIPELSLEAAEKHLKSYSDKNHGSAKCFCITPDVAERLLREFYGIPAASEGAGGRGIIDISDFL